MTITICGSMKFSQQMRQIANKLQAEFGYTVLECNYAHDISLLTDDDLQRLKAEHFGKIDNSDGIYVVNINGYIGLSVQKEIDYALSKGKQVIYHV